MKKLLLAAPLLLVASVAHAENYVAVAYKTVGYDTPVGDLDTAVLVGTVGKKVTDNLAFEVGAGLGVVDDNYQDEKVKTETLFSASAIGVLPINEKLSVNTNLSFSRVELSSKVPGYPEVKSDDTMFGYGVSAEYLFRTGMTASLGYQKLGEFKNDDVTTGIDIDSITLGLKIDI